MKVSGFSFVRNGVKFDYPFLEAISSILPICDEFVIAVGDSEDDTLQRIRNLNSPKIRIIETVWDESLRTGGYILAQQTNIALNHITGDWAFYLQADEVIHERDIPNIIASLERYNDNKQIEGLLFSYKHFFGSYRYIGTSRRWYRNEIRIVRNAIGVQSWKDAQGFRINGRKLRVKPIDASVYHYGWVRSPETQMAKQQSFHRLWHPDEWIQKKVGGDKRFNYHNGTKLELFTGEHPAAMKQRVDAEHWGFTYDPSRVTEPWKDRFLDWMEMKTGIRLGEYKNYKII